MKNPMKLLTTAAAVAGLLAASTAYAHGIWFAQRSNQLALIYGVGAEDLDAVKRLPLVTAISSYDADGKPVPTSLKANGLLAVVDSERPAALVAGVLFNGIWTKTRGGEWFKKGKDEVPNAMIAEKNYKYAVHIRTPLTAGVPILPEQTLQIIPLASKLPDTMGSPLKLQVLFQGKPVAGAKVIADFVTDPDAQPVKTAADGTVTIRLRNQGLNVITAIVDQPSDEPAKADKMEHLATLSFVLPHADE